MRVEVKKTTVYTFTQEEFVSLLKLKMWSFILNHLRDNERVRIE
jgi:hypothetical protein